MNKLLHTAIEAALKAGQKVLEVYHSDDFEIELKDDNSPLTRADKASHTVIESELRRTNIPILSEEGKAIPYEERVNWKQLWIVDPIDGTKEFIKRNGEFTVNIALVQDHAVELGVIYAPDLDTLYYGDENGSFRIEKASVNWINSKNATANALPLSSNTDEYVVVASKSHLTPETQNYIDSLSDKHSRIATISKGSSLKLCLVAEGSADCYPRFAPTMEWDIAAGHAICKYANCSLIDLKSMEEMRYNRKELLNNWFLVERIKT